MAVRGHLASSQSIILFGMHRSRMAAGDEQAIPSPPDIREIRRGKTP